MPQLRDWLILYHEDGEGPSVGRQSAATAEEAERTFFTNNGARAEDPTEMGFNWVRGDDLEDLEGYFVDDVFEINTFEPLEETI